MKKRAPVYLAISLIVSACATPQQIAQSSSAGRISGCTPEALAINDLKVPTFSNTVSWVATCKGVDYYCSGYNTGEGAFRDVSCAKTEAAPAAAKKLDTAPAKKLDTAPAKKLDTAPAKVKK